jgi:hypothetical protein
MFSGGDIVPVTWFGQTFLSFWWLFCIVIIAGYNGELISMLTTVSRKLPFQNLTELVLLLKEDKFKVCTENTTSFYNAMMLASAVSMLFVQGASKTANCKVCVHLKNAKIAKCKVH